MLMGYEHFALLAVPKELLADEILSDLLKSTCKEVIHDMDLDFTSGNPLFGHLHCLSSGSFSVVWWNAFDHFIYNLYQKTQIETIFLYVCEFDGETLEKHTYRYGIKEGCYRVLTFTSNDSETLIVPAINSLRVFGNITHLCNPYYY